MNGENQSFALERRKPELKALVLEDSYELRQYEVEILSELFPKVFAAGDGKEGMEIFNEHVPDFVLTDLEMPNMGGLKFLNQIRQTQMEIDTFVMVVSGHSSIQDESTALRLGANDFIAKPFDLRIILARIEVAIRTLLQIQNLKYQKYLLEQFSFLDPLTGLVNRDYLDKRYEEETAIANRYKRSFSCMQIVFDDAGSDNAEEIQTLQDVFQIGSEVVKKNLRLSDVPGRMGEERMCLLLPETNEAQAVKTSEKLLNIISTSSWPNHQSPQLLTASVGIASKKMDEDSSINLIEAAGEALQIAKSKGLYTYHIYNN